jgi:sulfate transport system ATP-binding protein
MNGTLVDHGEAGDRKFAGPPAISVRNLSKSLGQKPILTSVSFDITEGELLVLLGPSGSGKTTLLRIMAGLDQPDAGAVYLRGDYANDLPSRNRKLGVVFQDPALFPRMTVAENIAYGLRIRRRPRKEREERVSYLLSLVHLENHRLKYPSQLSGGERQRVAVARALSYHAEALLFDEPFSALDPRTRTDLRRQMRGLLRSLPISSLFITHDQEEALEMGDRVAVLNQGRLEQIGTPFEIYNHPQSEFVASFLGAANVLLGRWREGRVSIGALRLKAPPDVPELFERQAVKIIFRPEDVVLSFQPQLLDTPYYLGRAIVEDVFYVGSGERLGVRLILWPSQSTNPPTQKAHIAIVDDTVVEDFPLTITRSKWEVNEMELSNGDTVAVGLKDYRLLPHYPLGAETSAKLYEFKNSK